ncbi:unnamed protein product [Cuscuta europaea]|uniref:Uncharacterized protein n=1 Tax=Cuscuta europaea TaxID=41803 RepID=A0A9P0ZKH6_CUSEU|nr:unnamed protein product [Cuscuta europaea]
MAEVELKTKRGTSEKEKKSKKKQEPSDSVLLYFTVTIYTDARHRFLCSNYPSNRDLESNGHSYCHSTCPASSSLNRSTCDDYPSTSNRKLLSCKLLNDVKQKAKPQVHVNLHLLWVL